MELFMWKKDKSNDGESFECGCKNVIYECINELNRLFIEFVST